jgi:NADPH-dependent curcumin reductase CurA
MRSYAIGRIVASKSSKLAVGDQVAGIIGWTEYAAVDDKAVERVEIPANGRLTDVMGPLGGTGLTAYFGLLDVGQPKAGELVVVSGAAGATGSMVVQIAKLKGCRVVGLAGSDDKVEWLKELGCESALNYKASDFKEQFKTATKDLIDIYFDNGKSRYLC